MFALQCGFGELPSQEQESTSRRHPPWRRQGSEKYVLNSAQCEGSVRRLGQEHRQKQKVLRLFV